jgi:hypothetical protein
VPTRHRRNERPAIVHLLEGGRAHVAIAEALRSFPPTLAGARPRGVPHVGRLVQPRKVPEPARRRA